MTKDIEKHESENENLPTRDSSPNYYEAYGSQAVGRNFTGQILKFTKGRYPYGQHNERLEIGTRVIVDMPTLQVGWVKWQDGNPVDAHMGNVNEGYQPPKRPTLGDWNEEDPDDRHTDAWEQDEKTGEYRDCWQFNNSVVMRELGTTGDDEGLFTFVTSSRGGISAIGMISKKYGRKIREDAEALPIVELNTDSYPHREKKFGDIDIPVFDIVGWATAADVEDATETVVEETDEETGEVTEAKAAPEKTTATAARKPDAAKAAPKAAPKKAAPGKKRTRF
jgi:hypothetical protein